MLNLLADTPSTSWWMPSAGSTLAGDTDALYDFITLLSAIFFVGLIGVMLYFAWKYRRKSPDQKTSPISANHRLEIVWTIVPSLLLVVIFLWGFKAWINQQVPPDNPLDVRVTARQWSWQFDYPREGVTAANELVVPAGRPVRLTMTSVDVLHSFFVPEFRIKRDVVPRRYSVLWFEAPEPGTFNVFCAEYCGKDHSRMITRVKVLSPEDYQKWVDTGGGLGDMPASELGKIFFNRYGCVQCHNTDGTANTGPHLDGKYGSQETLSDGSTVTIDDNYIRESIMNPAAQVVQGFQPKMPTFKGKMKDKQLEAIIEYLKSIGK